MMLAVLVLTLLEVVLTAALLRAVHQRVGKSKRHAQLQHLAHLAVAGARVRLPDATRSDQARCAVELARHLDETDNGKRDFSDRTLAAAVDAELGKA